MVMMTNKGSTQTLNFMTPGAGVLMLGYDHIQVIYSEMHHFFKNLLLYAQA